MASAESYMVEGEREQTTSGRGLDGACGASIGPELHRFSSLDNVIGALVAWIRHECFRVDVTMMSITESFLCIPFPIAYTSPGRDLS
jgi:hypothetical protein